MLLIADYLVYNDTQAPSQLIVSGAAIVCVGGIYILWRRRMYWLTARLLVIFYTLMAIAITSVWGTGTPFGILLLGLVIILAGILLGAKYAFRTAIIASLVLFVVQIAANQGIYISHLLFSAPESGLGDVFSYTLLFIMIALVAWLFSKQSDYALYKAREAERALIEEKELLTTRVKERTLELQATQVEEMQNLYRFAELGQLSTALLHDLANHLTALTLDIEDLHDTKYSKPVQRARQNIRYLDSMISQVHKQLEGNCNVKRFNVATKVKDMIRLNEQRAVNHSVIVNAPRIIDRKPYFIKGDLVRFNQVATILIANAIDAYEDVSRQDNRTVKVSLTHTESAITLVVEDWGKGIPEEKRETIFQPFYSTKDHGMGVGLFIARRTIEEHFNGTLILDNTGHTRFILTIPHQK